MRAFVEVDSFQIDGQAISTVMCDLDCEPPQVGEEIKFIPLEGFPIEVKVTESARCKGIRDLPRAMIKSEPL